MNAATHNAADRARSTERGPMTMATRASFSGLSRSASLTLFGLGAALLLIGCGAEQAGPIGAQKQRQRSAAEASTTPAAPERDVSDRFAGAERVVVATVAATRAAYGTNAYGDKLILTTATLQVERTLRGPAQPRVELVVEGGTVGEITLDVSDMPRLRVGQRGTFAISKTERGRWVPHGRGDGIVLDGEPDHGHGHQRSHR